MRSLVFEKTLQTADLTLEEMMSSIYRLNSMAEKLFKSAVRKFSFKYDTAGPLLKSIDGSEAHEDDDTGINADILGFYDLDRINDIIDHIDAYRKKIYKEFLVKKPSKWIKEENKRRAIEMIKKNQESVNKVDKFATELRQTEKRYRRAIDKLEVMLRNANLISDADFQGDR